MAKERDRFHDSADQFGYARYSVVVHAPAVLAGKVQRFRDAIGMADFKTEPHVSISSTLFNLKDLDALKNAIRRVAAAQVPLRFHFADPPFTSHGDAGFFEIKSTPGLLMLHQSVIEALIGVIESNTPSDRPYWPHMTLYQRATEQEAAHAADSGPALDLGDGFDALTLDLVGRVGPPREGTRNIIDTFPFSGT